MNLLADFERRQRRTDMHGNVYYQPDFANSVSSLHVKLADLLVLPSKTVLFLIDSISYRVFQEHFRSWYDLDRLEVMSSVFPTGSACAYSSIFLGAAVAAHGVAGIAYFVPEYEGVYHVGRSAIVDSYNNVIRNVPFAPTTLRPWLDRCASPVTMVHPNHDFFVSSLWSTLVGQARRVPVSLHRSFGDLGACLRDVDTLMYATEQVMRVSGPQVIISLIDLDGPVHSLGVATPNTRMIYDRVSEQAARLYEAYPEYGFVFVSDHGQVDLRDAYEFRFEEIREACYASRGGLGRTLYFYSKGGAVDRIRDAVGTTGMVLDRADPLLETIFGFNPVDRSGVGDIVAIGTTPAFPSFGWTFAAEHGGLMLDEVTVPYLRLPARTPVTEHVQS